MIFTPERKIAALDLESGVVTILAEVEPELPGNRFNDGKCDPYGRFVGGTMKSNSDGEACGALYILDTDLSLRKLRRRPGDFQRIGLELRITGCFIWRIGFARCVGLRLRFGTR